MKKLSSIFLMFFLDLTDVALGGNTWQGFVFGTEVVNSQLVEMSKVAVSNEWSGKR